MASSHKQKIEQNAPYHEIPMSSTSRKQRILLTGIAGFIGYHAAKRLLARGDEVVGVDNLSDYYDVSLKMARLAQLEGHPNLKFIKLDIADREGLSNLFAEVGPDTVLNLAAQASVRHSLTNPHAYIDSNLVGFVNILEGCRRNDVKHLVFASSSSVYGANTKMPFSVHHNVDHPVSLYGATKKANEVMAHSYSHLYDLPCTGLRFFTAYGPWGRPDMALFLFTKAILEDRPIDVFNNGQMQRDFTYIDDIVEGLVRIIDKAPEPNPNWSANIPDPGTSRAPYKLYNIGNHNPVRLLYMIELLEACLGKKARKNMLPMQPGDIPATYADISNLTRDIGFRPSTSIKYGIKQFVEWYRDYYSV